MSETNNSLSAAESSIDFSNNSEDYSSELNRILERYEKAANEEQFYLLQFSFQLTNSYYTIDCGLSTALDFSSIVRLRTESTKITFDYYQWSQFIFKLRSLQDAFFKNSMQQFPNHFGDSEDHITVNPIIYEDHVKQLMVMKHFTVLYLSESDVEQILNLELSIISHRLSLLENLNFCMYYHDALNTIQQTIPENTSIIELLKCFCDSEGSCSLAANALRDYIYYYNDKILSDFNKCI